MAARQFYQAAASTRQTTTNTDASPATACTLTFTPDAGSDYYIICLFSADCSVAAASSQVRFTLNDVTGSTTKLAETVYAFFNTSDVVPAMVLGVVASSATPVQHAIQLVYGQFGNASTAGLRDVQILAVKADAQDRSTASVGSTTSSTTYSAAATLTWTPATAGTYVILAAGVYGMSGSTAGGKVRLFDGTTAYGEITTTDMVALGEQYPWQYGMLTASLSGAQTWTIQTGVTTATTFTIATSWTRIIALRVDQLPGAFGTRSTTASTTTATTFTSFASTTPTLSAANHLVLASFVGGKQGPIKFQGAKATVNISPSASVARRSGSTTATRDWSQATGALLYAPSGSAAIAAQYGSVTAATTSGIDEAAVVAIQLDVTPAGRRVIPSPAAAVSFVQPLICGV